VLQTQMSQVQAVIYFDTRVVKSGLTFDWRLRSSAGSMAAWTEMARDPYFNP